MISPFNSFLGRNSLEFNVWHRAKGFGRLRECDRRRAQAEQSGSNQGEAKRHVISSFAKSR